MEKHSPARGKGQAALSAQQTVPYVEMLKDGVYRVRDGYYTKTITWISIIRWLPPRIRRLSLAASAVA